MDKLLQQIIEETRIKPELFPMDFFYSDTLKDKKEIEKQPAEIYVKKYNQTFIKVKNSHRPVSKMLNANLIIKIL